MTTIRLHETTAATPQQFVAGLTDFGPGRAELFANSADDDLKVHSKSADQADVTEGSRGTWERLHYDWSDPSRVVLETTDSNTWANSSTHTYTSSSRPDGKTDVAESWSTRRRGRTGSGSPCTRAATLRTWSRRS